MQIRKRGDEIKKKSSPLKLLSQSQPNFAEMILGWSPFKTALFYARKCPNLNCISIMMSFLTYITGFFMNFELLPILTDYANLKKGGMKLKKYLL
jgi:hypothetical protein